MMLHKGNLKKRGGSSSTRIPSTFIKYGGKIPHLAQHMLHSKSTYFYRWGSRKKLSSKVTFLLPSVCILALLVGGIVAVNPTVDSKKAYATITGGSATGGTESGETTPSIALSFPTEGLPEGFDNSENQVTTVRTNEVAYRSNIFTITTENIEKYHIAVQAANGYNSELRGATTGEVIAGVGNNKAVGSFGDNVWGYALTEDTSASDAALTYSTVPASGNSVPQEFTPSDTAAETKNFKLTFAARIGDDKPSDHYQTKVLLSAAMSAREMAIKYANWTEDYHISKMTDLTADICGQAELHTTGQLTDDRDGTVRSYWVTKMADGNCWMSQNLAYDINSDPNATSRTKFTTSVSGWENTVWDYSAYYNPTAVYIWTAFPSWNTSCSSVENINACTSNGWAPANMETVLSYRNDLSIDSSWTVTYSDDFVRSSQYVGSDGVTICSKTANSFLGNTTSAIPSCRMYYYKYAENIAMQNSMNYDAGHYTSGNYYTRITAMNNASNTTAVQGICPSGWQLPNGSGVGSFATLFNAYTLITNGAEFDSASYGLDVRLAPFYFTPSSLS